MVPFINRDIYLQKVRPYIGKPIIKVFTGQRRVGKSYLMFQVMEEIKKNKPGCNVIFIDKEKNEFDFIKDYNDLLKFIKEKAEGKENSVFIDEIQDIEFFENALRSLYTEPDFDIYCTGSNARILSGELATYLSGRYVEIKVYSLSYTEFLTFHNLQNNNHALQQYLKFGGLPYLIHLDLNEEVIFDYLNNIYASILYKDVIRRYNIRNVSFLESLINFLADNMGSIVSAKKISDFLKSQHIQISPNVILNYLSYLSNSFFIYKAKRQDIIGKKIFEIGEKYYFEDTGLRNSIAGYKTTDTGKIIENVVYSHLKINGYTVRVGVMANAEIDFVAEKQGERIYVQVCYLLQDEATIEREFGNLLTIKDNYPKYVVSMDEMFGKNTFRGIKHIHLKKFLSEPI